MLTKIENFSNYQQRIGGDNDFDKTLALFQNYCRYLNENKQASSSFFPYFEKKYFIFLLENPNLYSWPLRSNFFFDCLKSIFKSHINLISLSDYQKLFDSLEKIENFSDTGFEQKATSVRLGCELLEALLARSNEGSSESITWLREKIITSLSEALPYYLAEHSNGVTDDFFPLLTQVAHLDFDKFYEKEIIEFIVAARSHFTAEVGSCFICLFNDLFKQQKYELILKLYRSGQTALKNEIEWVVRLSTPIPSILKEIVPIQDPFVEEIKNAVLACLPATIKERFKQRLKSIYLGPYFYNILSQKVLELGKKEEEWCEKLERYIKETENHSSYFSFYSRRKDDFNRRLKIDYQLKIKKSESLETYEFPDNRTAQNLPSGLYIAIINAGKTIPPSYFLFAKHFQKINAKNKERYQIDFNYFLLTRLDKIINLYEVMGDNAFLFMKKMIKTSVQSLTRYIDNLNYIPTEYWPLLERLASTARHEQVKNSPSIYDQLISFISDLEFLRKELSTKAERTLFRTGNPNYQTILEQFTTNSASARELKQFLNHTLQAVYKRLLALPDEVDVDLSIFDRKPNLFLRLLVGRQQLRTPLLQRVFDHCIEHDLRSDVDFDDFAHSLDQLDEFGKSLAKHNHAILKELEAAKINTDLAFNYALIKEFSYTVTEGTDWEGLAQAIYADLINLSKHLNIEELSLRKNINLIRAQVTKANKPNFKPIYNGSLNKILSKINQQLTNLLAQVDISAATTEFAKHFQDHYANLCQQAQKTSLQETKQQVNRKFYAKVWDKKQLETFILGDYLSCCLAPDGGQFTGIVQRRMDKAMMMHVIYDAEFNEPVCGNWLFFAKNKRFPHEIFLVANFFEIRAGYAHNKSLRDQLVQQLLDFTGSYAKKIGAKGFLLRPLEYGMIPDFKGKYRLRPMQIEKVGGFFSLPSDEFGEVESYYLDALDVTNFYFYESQEVQIGASSWSGIFTEQAASSKEESENLINQCLSS